MDHPRRILYCHCAFAQVIPKDVKQGVLERLSGSGADFECVPDLCEMSARRDPMLQQLAEQPNTRIAACYPRAVEGLFTAAGSPLKESGLEIINLRVLNADEAVEALLRPAATATPETATPETATPETATTETAETATEKTVMPETPASESTATATTVTEQIVTEQIVTEQAATAQIAPEQIATTQIATTQIATEQIASETHTSETTSGESP